MLFSELDRIKLLNPQLSPVSWSLPLGVMHIHVRDGKQAN